MATNYVIRSVNTGKMVNCYECADDYEEVRVKQIVTVHNALFPADQWKLEIDAA